MNNGGGLGYYSMDISIRRALPADSPVLTALSFLSKSYWHYPKEYLDIWQEELTIKGDYIARNMVYAAEAGKVTAGFYSVMEGKTGPGKENLMLNREFWLDHLFVLPRFIGKGLGSALFRHAGKICGQLGCRSLKILADPNAAGFYEKMGARYIKEWPSSIPGRTIPFFEFYID
jgi:GNAT superfamily N-acetyltransferase